MLTLVVGHGVPPLDTYLCDYPEGAASTRLGRSRRCGAVDRETCHWFAFAPQPSLDALAREHLERARQSSAGRSAEAVVGGHEHVLRQTLVALRAGTVLGEHENPGEATVHVLSGRVRLSAGADSWEGRGGDLLVVPDARHDLQAVEDAVVVLTVALRGPR